ncbi:MAG: T9SS type A sorting domain-containing protein [Ignavibacterium sp.]|nr:T9SS type A sorting domain-containing protein [Ignavibacterium sp.]
MKNLSTILLIVVLLSTISIQETYSQETYSTGTMKVRVDAYGAMRFWTIEGTDTVQHINRTNVLVAGNPNEVLDYYNDIDIEVPTTLETNPLISDYEISGTYNNAYSELPPNVLVEQHVYGWQGGKYALIKMIVTNNETAALPTIVGLDIVQYVDLTWEDDKVFWDAANKMLVQFESHFVGIKYLSEPVTSAQVLVWYDGYSSDDSTTYAYLTEGTFDTDTLTTTPDGAVSFLAGESLTLQPQEFRTLYLAVALGANETEMLANMQLAQQKYNQIVSVEADYNNIPANFVLDQNYPNPFNPSTKISFGLPERSNVVLKIFNALGQQVAELVNESLEAGTYLYNFDASAFTSGIYFYSLQTDAGVVTKKMTLIK